ncbi:MAG TPA: sortase [Candidatus Paceibacterota bacterium]|nr:sortase [Candidatus Paceibacterota bacterium]
MLKVSNKISLIALLLCLFMLGNNAGANASSSTAPGTDFNFTRNLTLGFQGDDVSALQQFLIADGFLKISTSTGYFGPLTTAALGAWQASEGVSPAVGFFGPISRGVINAMTTGIAVPVGALGVQSTTVATTTAATGTTSASSSNENGFPVSLIIPKLNIDAPFQYTGLNSDGTLQVPTTIYDVGWFTGSVLPGEKGVAIVMGHVAQIRRSVVTKLGVFSDLSELTVGDKLSVINNEGQTTNFVVTAVRTYDSTADATDVFTSTDGGAHLNLITCEGTWVQSQLSYTQRLVVFTEAVQ